MASKLVRIEAPMTGVFGQIVNVGDEVMVMTTAHGNAYLKKGKYLGYVEGSGYYKQRAQIAISEKRRIQLKPDGTEFDCNKDYHRDTWKEVSKTLTYKEIPHIRIATLNLNRIATLKS